MKSNCIGNNDLSYRYAYLLSGYIRDTLTSVEHDELDDWVNEDDRNMKLFEDVTDEANLPANLKWLDEMKTKATKSRYKYKKPYTVLCSFFVLGFVAGVCFSANKKSKMYRDKLDQRADV